MSSGMPTISHRSSKWIVVAGVVAAIVVVCIVVWIMLPIAPAQQFRNGWNALAKADLPQVDAAADSLAKKPGFESHSHLLRGAALLRRGRSRESLEELRQALDHDDTRVAAQVLAGEALARLQQSLRASEVLREALAKDPDNVEAHRWAGVTFYDLGAMEPAVHHLERLAELAPQDPRPHRVMGLIYKDLENDQRAANCYEESLKRSDDQPDIDTIRTELAEVQIRLNRHAAAKETLSPCTPSARVLALQAECESALGNQSAAKVLLTAALKKDPRDDTALLLKGTFALTEGQPGRAIAALQQVVKHSPNDFTARFKLSQAFAQSGDEPHAAEQLTAMNQIKEIRREANQVYQQAVGHPRDAEARFRLGLLSEKLNRPDLAHMWYQAVLSIDPNHSPAQTALTNLGSGP
jgi:tetratricopeptide (TPR) repeat protein